jgi:hypothetical protein
MQIISWARACSVEMHESATAVGEQRSSLVQLDGEISYLWILPHRGPLRSGCAPLVAVVKTADLRSTPALRYLRFLIETYRHSNSHLKNVIAAYNAGDSPVDRYH